MQILHWLVKVAHDQATETHNPKKSSTNTNKSKEQEIVLFRNCGRQRRGRGGGAKKEKKSCGSRNYYVRNPFAFLCRRDVAKDCFYSTLDLKTVGGGDDCSNRRERWRQYMKKQQQQKKEEELVGTSHHVGKKVLPVVGDSTPPTTGQRTNAKGGNKTRSGSRMKELVRWAAGAKYDKKDKFLGRNKCPASMAAVSSSCSAADASGRCDRKGNWITTDSEFVVLEL